MAAKIESFGKSHSTELIFFPIFMLMIIGVFGNNLAASGIQTTPTFIQSSQYGVGIVTPNSANGCDSSKQNCNFTAVSGFSFLNPNSPFTFLLEGNVLGFLTNVLNNGEASNYYNNGYTYCIPQLSNGTLTNSTGSLIRNFQCYGYVSNNGVSTFQTPTLNVVLNATSNNGNESLWNLEGCPYANSLVKTVTNPNKGGQSNACGLNYGGQWGQVSSNMFYIKNGSSITSGQCTVNNVVYTTCGPFWRLYFSGGVTTFTCPTFTSEFSVMHTWNDSGTSPFIRYQVTPMYCLIPYTTQSGSTQANLASVLGFWGFLAGIILLILGMGISLSAQTVGTGFSFGSNEQGSRQAVILGIFILVWSFIYSEFGYWLTDFALGFGNIIFITFAVISFVGIYWRMFSLD